ncbi:Flagellar biosynthesis anti-sigma factor FlgM [Candidatus Desulfosporosinus infrequens]|uniref:Negative regulator of flagellin synthesis n=1 Tax=Candidatus Desulfosporosinus infrequens TaxID=2043169 RepID=A0A2U3KLN8_9FIRM|nr:Flagellar biosynthesis anti-sigma factor FlgM [Candidatus Desulfosporosinus infrequens]
MKIDGAFISPVGSTQAANRVNQTQTKSPVSKADQLAVSDKAQVYQALLQKVKEIPSVREDKVKTLTDQIASGKFVVDGQKIAEKISSDGL